MIAFKSQTRRHTWCVPCPPIRFNLCVFCVILVTQVQGPPGHINLPDKLLPRFGVIIPPVRSNSPFPGFFLVQSVVSSAQSNFNQHHPFSICSQQRLQGWLIIVQNLSAQVATESSFPVTIKQRTRTRWQDVLTCSHAPAKPHRRFSPPFTFFAEPSVFVIIVGVEMGERQSKASCFRTLYVVLCTKSLNNIKLCSDDSLTVAHRLCSPLGP